MNIVITKSAAPNFSGEICFYDIRLLPKLHHLFSLIFVVVFSCIMSKNKVMTINNHVMEMTNYNRGKIRKIILAGY